MKPLLALDLVLGVELEQVIRDCVQNRAPFCVLDPRVSPSRREEELAALGATAVLSSTGRTNRANGRMVDDEVGLVMLTSGSSGAPKAAELTWDALTASAVMTQRHLDTGHETVWYPVLPANHIGGLAVILRAVLGDARLLWGEPADIEQAPRRGATHVAIVRTQLARHNVAGFEKVLLGGARPPSAVGANIIATWGMTETGSGVVYDGRALEGVDVASIADEIAVRSPTLFRSYRTMERPRILGPDGRDDWFPTGDAGEVVDGRVSVKGRVGYVINTGGEKLWPDDLEAVIATVPGVLDVAVTSVEDPEWGQRVVALVVSTRSGLDDAIADVARDRIGPWAKPKEVRFVQAIPRTTNGKIRRGELASLL
ncbi:MAG TPA: AMP-binding protein [Acidimicrobiales bacterium]